MSEIIGVGNMLKVMGHAMRKQVLTDSSAANGIVLRRGAGKVKHLEVRQLWVQDHVEKGEIICTEIPRHRNLADLFTHHWTHGESAKFDDGLGLERLPF